MDLQALNIQPEFFDDLAYYRPYKDRGPVLVCLSGYQDTGRSFMLLEPVLTHFDLIMLDWRGQGWSKSKQHSYTIQEAFADLVRFMNVVVAGISKEPVHIVAHSMGAALAARFAGTLPDTVRSLVLLEGFSGVLSPDAEAERLSAWAERYGLVGRTEPHQMKDIAEVERILSRIHQRSPQSSIQQLAKLLTRPVDPQRPDAGFIWVHDPNLKAETVPLSFPPHLSRALWQRITAPALLFLGKQSQLHPGAKKLSEILSHFHTLKLHEIDNAGHNVHYDQPEIVADKMESFYRKHNMI